MRLLPERSNGWMMGHYTTPLPHQCPTLASCLKQQHPGVAACSSMRIILQHPSDSGRASRLTRHGTSFLRTEGIAAMTRQLLLFDNNNTPRGVDRQHPAHTYGIRRGEGQGGSNSIEDLKHRKVYMPPPLPPLRQRKSAAFVRVCRHHTQQNQPPAYSMYMARGSSKAPGVRRHKTTVCCRLNSNSNRNNTANRAVMTAGDQAARTT